jgi:hypothetical protein
MDMLLPLEAVASLSVQTPEQPRTTSTETVSEALAKLLGPTCDQARTKSIDKLSPNSKNSAFHIVDITDQYVGKSLIITGAKKP